MIIYKGEVKSDLDEHDGQLQMIQYFDECILTYGNQ